MCATWDYVGTALQKYHAIGTLAEHDRDGDTLSIRLQVPTCRAATAERVALSAGDSAPWLFEHMDVDRITFDLEAVTDAGDDPARVTFAVRREWFGDPDVEPIDRILDSMDRERSPKR
jgi:hypothetical protein